MLTAAQSMLQSPIDDHLPRPAFEYESLPAVHFEVAGTSSIGYFHSSPFQALCTAQ
jgi:hypothetical protein